MVGLPILWWSVSLTGRRSYLLFVGVTVPSASLLSMRTGPSVACRSGAKVVDSGDDGSGSALAPGDDSTTMLPTTIYFTPTRVRVNLPASPTDAS